MKAQVRVRKDYVVVRFTHQQLQALDHAIANGTLFEDPRTRQVTRTAAEIVAIASRASLTGERGAYNRHGEQIKP